MRLGPGVSVCKYIDGLAQYCSNSIANALQFCGKPSIYVCARVCVYMYHLLYNSMKALSISPSFPFMNILLKWGLENVW